MSNDGRPTESDSVTTVVSLESPPLETARAVAAAAIDRGALVTLVGRCRVEDSSAAAREPNRELMGVTVVKPDGTVIVHDSEGTEPVASSPPGGEHAVSVDDDVIILESRRGGSEDGEGDGPHLDESAGAFAVRFEAVDHLSAVGGQGDVHVRDRDASSQPPSTTEDDLRRQLLEAPELLEPGFRPLATERETPAGPIDVYGEDASGRTVVVELKSRRAGPDAVSQLHRYVDALERDLHAETTVRGILVAPSVTARADRLLARYGLEFVGLEASTDGGSSA